MLGLSAAGDGTKAGREGNRAYRSGDYEQAANAYRSALQESDSEAQFALRHNLGASLYRLGRSGEAREQFAAAASAAESPSERALAEYNAGNAALAAGDYAAAVAHFRAALRDQPDHEDARFNYEFARRQTPPESESDESMSGEDESGEGDGESEASSEPDQGQEGGDAEAQPERGDQPDQSGTPQPEADDDGRSGEQQQSGQPSQQLTREQAEQILGALEQGEERLLREIQKAPYRARNVDKDW